MDTADEFAFWAKQQEAADDSLTMWYMMERLLLLGCWARRGCLARCWCPALLAPMRMLTLTRWWCP